MAHSCPFGLFILVLCLTACVCAYADEDEAQKAVKKAKKSVDDAVDKAQREVINAEEFLIHINTQKSVVEEASKEAENSAKGNTDASSIAQTAQTALDGITALYPKALERANKYIDCIKELKTIASTLFVNSKNLHTSAQTRTDYTKLKEDAVELKTQAKVLENNITTAKSSFGDMSTIKWQMKKFVSDARIVKYQVDAIVSASKFDTLLNASEKNVTLTEEKRDKISDIEKEMQKLYDESTSDTSHQIWSLHSNVRGSLSTVSNAVQRAKTAMESIINLKQTVYDALESAKSATDERNAKTGVENVNWFVQKAEKEVEKITQALQTATIKENDALSWKNEAINAINNKNKKPAVEHDREETNSQDSTKTHKPLQSTKEIPTVNKAKQPTITNLNEPVSKERDHTKVTKESPTVREEKQPTITNSNKAVSEGKVPTEVTKKSPTESKTIKPTTINIKEKPVTEGTDTTQKTIDGPSENEIMKPNITIQDHTGSKESVKETIGNPTGSEGKEHTEDTKESPTESETIKPTTKNSDESMNEQDMENTTESPVVRGTRQPTITNPNKPVSGGKDLTRHDQSDSAMTVPVPLILALIAFAVLN